jgi:rSAM/selenodomain-associated transferase 2
LISVIIPTLDEERALPATLDAVLAQPVDLEVIVVDGGSVDRTRQIVETTSARHPRLHVLGAARGRALQMNAGADVARGEWLLFLHADTLLPRDGLTVIENQLEAVQAGCFTHRFSGEASMLRILSWFHNHRFGVTRVIYGDQAMFIRRRLFEKLGGFPIRPMEDIAFGLKLRTATRPIMLRESVTTDSRKFDQMGHLRALAHSVFLLLRFRFGTDLSGDRFFRNYR